MYARKKTNRSKTDNFPHLYTCTAHVNTRAEHTHTRIRFADAQLIALYDGFPPILCACVCVCVYFCCCCCFGCCCCVVVSEFVPQICYWPNFSCVFFLFCFHQLYTYIHKAYICTIVHQNRCYACV